MVVFRDVSERLAARIITAADAERRRIARDLHDGAQQRLVQVLMGVEEARRDPARAADALTRAAADARRAIEDLRDLVNGVHPLVLTDRGIAVALEELTANAPVVVDLDVTEERFAPEIEAAAYFTVAEALTNVAKHAEATVADVRIARDGDALVIEVADDGRGGARLNPGLQDRLAVLNGTLELVPARAGHAAARRHPALSESEHGQHALVLGPVAADVELAEDRRHVLLHGGRPDGQPLRDPVVGQPFGHQRQHLALARRQRLQRVRPPAPAEHPRDHLGVQRRAAATHRPHGVDEVAQVRDPVLEHVPDPARVVAHELVHVPLHEVLGEHQHAHVGLLAPDLQTPRAARRR